jgi:hypothetical protein
MMTMQSWKTLATRNARPTGTYMALAGLCLVVGMSHLSLHLFKIYCLALVLVFTGAWVVATGQLYFDTDDAPLWWTIGLGVAFAVALAVAWITFKLW